MAATHPVTFSVTRPQKFERPQVFLRILVMVILSLLAGAIGWILGGVYLIFPVLAAIFISQKGAQRFLEEEGPRMTNWLRWVVALYSYLLFLTDRFPVEKPEELVHFDVQRGGAPTTGSALLRLIYSIPSALVLGLLAIVSAIICIIAVVMILVQESYPEAMYNFQAGVMRWQARLLGYHASLTDVYPPWALDTGPAEPSPAAPV